MCLKTGHITYSLHIMTRIEEMLEEIEKGSNELESLHSKIQELIIQRTGIYESLKSIDSDTNKLTGEKFKTLERQYNSLQSEANELNRQHKMSFFSIREDVDKLAKRQSSLEQKLIQDKDVFK